mgnify:CR=1 FL=1
MVAHRSMVPLLLLLSLLVSGCGFQLKGSVATSHSTIQGQSIRLISNEPRSELTVALSQELQRAGALRLDTTDASLILQLGPEIVARRNLSLTVQGRSAEVELTMSSDVSLTHKASMTTTESTATVVRQFLNDPNNVVGSTEEMRLLQHEMRADLAAQIVRRLSYRLNN